MDRRHGDPPVAGGVELPGVKAGGVLEKAGERRVLVVLVVGLGGAAQRAEVLEHPLGVAAAVGVGGVVALVLVVADQPARHGHRGDRDVADRPSADELAPDLLEPGAELDHPHARGLRADSVVLADAGAGGDQVTAVMLTRPGDNGFELARVIAEGRFIADSLYAVAHGELQLPEMNVEEIDAWMATATNLNTSRTRKLAADGVDPAKGAGWAPLGP